MTSSAPVTAATAESVLVGAAFLPSGWGESFLRSEFAGGVDALLSALHGRDGTVGLDELCDLAWHTVTAPYVLDDATGMQLATGRRMNDRDARRTLDTPESGDPVHQITVTLVEVADLPCGGGC